LSVSFTPSHGIPDGGRIIISIDPDWNPVNDTCDVEGLENLSTTTVITCTRLDNVFYIQGFLGFTTNTTIIVSWPDTMVPENFREEQVTRQTRYFNFIRTEAYITNTWVTID